MPSGLTAAIAEAGMYFKTVINRFSELTSIPSKDLVGSCKERTIVKARLW
jgi:hypothetical protein